MRSRILKALFIEKEETGKTFLLLIQAFLSGIFIASLDIGAQSLFLESYNAVDIPTAFILSGIFGIIMIWFYALLRKKISHRFLPLINTLFFSLVVTLLMIIFYLKGTPLYIFISFALMAPLIMLVLMGFRDMIRSLLDSYQLNRLGSLISLTQSVGVIVLALLIPVLVDYGMNARFLMLIASISSILLLLTQSYSSFFILKKQSSQISHANKGITKGPGLQEIFNDRYVIMILGFVSLSIVSFVFIHFSFLSLADLTFENATSLASFLGWFLGGVMIFSVLFESYVYPALLKSYGLKIVMFLSPVLILLTLLVILLLWQGMDIQVTAAGVGVVFTLVIFMRIFSSSLKDTVDIPVSRILIQPLEDQKRSLVGKLSDKRLMGPVTVLSATILLVLISLELSLLQIHYVIIILAVAWIYLGFRVYREYHRILRDSLQKIRKPMSISEKKARGFYERVTRDKPDKWILWLLEFAPQSWNGFITDNLRSLLLSRNSEIMELTIDWIENLNVAESRNVLLFVEQQLEVRKTKRIRFLIDRYNHITPQPDREFVEAKITSIKWEDRLFAITALLRKPELLKHGMLIPLLNDNDFQVRISTIRFIGTSRLTEYTHDLLELLESERFYPFAFNALDKMSAEILPALNRVYRNPDNSGKLILRVTRLIASADSEEKVNYLADKLDRNELDVIKVILESLILIDYRPYEHTRIKLQAILHKFTSLAAWDLSILESCRLERVNPELIRAMELEFRKAYKLIFLVLSVLYGKKAMEEIERNINLGTPESIGYAIQLLDLFVDEEIKPGMFTFFRNIKRKNRIRKLQDEFPVSAYSGEDLLHAIINRDYNFIDTFTRVLAIKELEKLKNYTVSETLVAQLFNPDDIVAETSVQQVIKRDPDIMADVLPRLPSERRRFIYDVLERKTTKRFGDSLETLHYLKKCMQLPGQVNDFILFRLAMNFRIFNLRSGENLDLNEIFEDNSFLLAGTSQFSVVSGNMEIRSFIKDEIAMVKTRHDSPEKNLNIKTLKNLKLYALPVNVLREVIFDNEDEFFSLIPSLFTDKKTPSSSV